MRKMICILLAMLMVISLAGCTEKKDEQTGTGSESSKVQENSVSNGQNPAMNIVGKYGCDKATLLIEAAGSTGTKVTIDMPVSASEKTQWTMTGNFDPAGNKIEYTDGSKKTYTYDENGKL